jgi:chromosome partitioning protein
MAYTVAITNQKGGVGKTTTAVNLAAALAIAERRTLLVDADPQGNTTSGVGVAKLELQVSLYDVLVDDHPVHDVIRTVPGLPYLSVLPATQDLVGAELQLVERPFRESALRRVLEPVESEYDYIVVDCPPSLGLLTLNVLAAVQQLIIPIQCEYYGLEGISQLLNTVRLVQQNINPGLAIGGVLLTMYDSRLNLCRQVAEDATEYFGPKVFGTPIPRNVRLAEAPSFGKPILLYDVQSVGAKSYLAVAQELLRRVEGTDVTIAPTQVAAATAQAAAAVSTAGVQSAMAEEASPEQGAPPEPDVHSDHQAESAATDIAAAPRREQHPSDHGEPIIDEPTIAASETSPQDSPSAQPEAQEVTLQEAAPQENAAQMVVVPAAESVSADDESVTTPDTPRDVALSLDSAAPAADPESAIVSESREVVPPAEGAAPTSVPSDQSNAEEISPAEHQEPVGVSVPLANADPDASPRDDNAEDDEARRSNQSSESMPEVTT